MTMRVLVLDDYLSIRLGLKRLLESFGYEVILTAHPTEALEAMLRDPADVVLTDYSMPEMDGIEFAAELDRIWQGPILLMTGYDGREFLQVQADALAVGIRKIFAKPGFEGLEEELRVLSNFL